MHGLVALDAQNQEIRPSLLWCDQRTQKQCDWLTERTGGVEGLLTYTNNRMLTGYTGG
jgi:xylulokinase